MSKKTIDSFEEFKPHQPGIESSGCLWFLIIIILPFVVIGVIV